jgi:hypothetical protein
MANVTLQEFIGTNREELIKRCRAKVAKRSAPTPTKSEIDHGVPLFLDQLVGELGPGPSKTKEITEGAIKHGHDLLLQGFTVSQVVHDYGDVCQSVTDLAVELAAPISNDDFRTLNRCLDNAIAGAVTEHSREQELTRDGESTELRNLAKTAITAFEVLQTGSVGVAGRTGDVVLRSLKAIRTILEAPPTASVTKKTSPSKAKEPVTTS